MPYTAFHNVFPNIAERETRSFAVFNDPELPTGNYGMVEMYCDEPGCDCRRVFFMVISSVTERPEAVIGYGWESADFYAKWLGDDDPDTIDDLKGPSLNLLSPQSELAPAILRMVENVLRDVSYVERLKRHYKMFRDHIKAKARRAEAKGKRKRRKKR